MFADTAAGESLTAATLREERIATQGFLELLQLEQECLLTGDADAIGAHIENKSACLRKLAGYAERRCRFLLGQQLSPDRPGMEQWLANAGESAAIAAAEWQQLLEATRLAREVNETNGSLIAVRIQSNQQALAVLTAAASGAGLYGRDGQASGNRDSRRLGAA
ncbi:MAG: flagellar protein FlgN [Burkholderiales bacterium]|nr:flagellar protein FlgN [Burkholderiales bacterium]MDP2399287.1 flagellar protein FlgN [Burkholderiales bacterium]